MANVTFLKLGGSLITDKTGLEAVRPRVLARIAVEIRQALSARLGLRLVIGHGSGSFAHVPAAKHGTRQGVQTDEQWRGFAEVSRTAARLNRLVCETLADSGIAAISLQPSASALCIDGQVVELAVQPVLSALEASLTPVVYGDVAFDAVRGGTVISTEEIMAFIAPEARPGWLLLAGETEGVLDSSGKLVPYITSADLPRIGTALKGSRGADVTGGMAAKVAAMLELQNQLPGLSVRIFSGLKPANVERLLLDPTLEIGTLLPGRS